MAKDTGFESARLLVASVFVVIGSALGQRSLNKKENKMWLDSFMDIWRMHQFYSFMILTAAIGYQICKRWNLLVGFTFMYVAMSAVYMFQGPGATWANLQPRIDTSAAASWAELVGMILYISNIEPKHISVHLLFMEILIIINCVIVIIFGYGMFNAHTMDSAVIAIFLPSMWFRSQHSNKSWLDILWLGIKIILPIWACLVAGGSTLYLGLTCGVIAYQISNRSSKKWLFVLPAIAAVAYWSEGNLVLKGGGRIPEWERFYNWWSESAEWLIGTGTGSFLWLGPTIELNEGQKEYMIFMHNDYLQIIFEQGLIGFGLCMCLGADLVKRALKTPWLFSTVITIAAVSLTYYPLRWSVSSFYMMLIARICLENGIGVDWESLLVKLGGERDKPLSPEWTDR